MYLNTKAAFGLGGDAAVAGGILARGGAIKRKGWKVESLSGRGREG